MIAGIKETTRSYEAWLAAHTPMVSADLLLKHRQMAAAPFPFLRATLYRWAQLWPEVCPELTDAPAVLAVGDLHVENFGTWRDAEGRLVWGVNDFDEAYVLPYTSDLVRLAASALLAAAAGHFTLQPKRACAAILGGYAEWLERGGRPLVLAERNRRLRVAVQAQQVDPARFWARLNALPTAEDRPADVTDILKSALPDPDTPFRLTRRVAGVGSLGRQRFVALTEWQGGQVAREAKALLPSACTWALDVNGQVAYQAILKQSVRCADPCLKVTAAWVVRRLAPDCLKLELGDLAAGRDELRLLRAMGRETANIHLGSAAASRQVKADLARRPDGWLHVAAAAMVKATLQDWRAWQRGVH